MKKGDLVHFEYLTRHHNGVGWEYHKGVGVIVDYNPENDSYRIMTEDGSVVERLDMQIDVISSGDGGKVEEEHKGKPWGSG